MSDHSELIGEMSSVERLSTAERLKHARKRRMQQLKKFAQYEKQLEKESSKKKKKQDASAHKVRKKKEEKVHFEHSVTLLEATARNDIEEGKILFLFCSAHTFSLFLHALNPILVATCNQRSPALSSHFFLPERF